MKRKKIIISTYTFLPDIGGVATNSLTIAEAFIDQGYDVTIVTLTKECSEIDSRLKVVRSPKPWRLFKLYRDADWVLLANLSLKLFWPLVILKKNTALQHHSSSAFKTDKSSFKGKVKEVIERKVINKSIHFVNSSFTKLDGSDFFCGLKTYITYPIMQVTNLSDASIKEYNKRKNAVFVGRLEPEKGVEFLYENIELIKKTLQIDSLTFLGAGSLLSDLKAKGRSDMDFIGAVDLTTVYGSMAQAKYVFVPSIWAEPFGMVAAEGLASGCIVICSDRGGLPEAVGDLAKQFDLSSVDSFEQVLINAKAQSDAFKDTPTLLNYQSQVNVHLRQFSGLNVTAVMIQAFQEQEFKYK